MLDKLPQQQTPNTKHQTPNTKHQTPNTKHQTTNTKHQTPNTKQQTTNMNTNNPFEIESNKPSSFLNVLTILSIIGSIIALLQAVFGFFTADKNYENMKKTMSSTELDNAPGFVKGMFNEKTLMMAEKMADNKLPILITGILGAIICLWGAIEMRKLKKQGYTLWMIGELLPLIAVSIFIGAAAFSGLSLIGYLFPLLFIILYTVYRKELKN